MTGWKARDNKVDAELDDNVDESNFEDKIYNFSIASVPVKNKSRTMLPFKWTKIIKSTPRINH